MNDSLKLVLRSPLHGMISNNILLLTFTGRRSGKTYATPVSYSQFGDEVYVFTHATSWWKNLRGGSPVTVRIRGCDFKARAEAIAQDKRAVAAGLMKHLRKVPSDARFYHVTFDDHGKPRVDEVEQAAQAAVMIRIRLC